MRQYKTFDDNLYIYSIVKSLSLSLPSFSLSLCLTPSLLLQAHAETGL